MKRRHFIQQASLGAAGLSIGCTGDSSLAAPIRWNILFFMSDEHNVKMLGCDGMKSTTVRTPHMDRLAREGVYFPKTYCAYPVCAPTRSSLVTAEFPQRHGQLSNGVKLLQSGPQQKTPSIAHVFRQRGYNTALIGKTHSNNQTQDSLPDSEFFMGFDYRLESSGASDGLGGAPIPNRETLDARRTKYHQENPVGTGKPKPEWEDAVWAVANKLESGAWKSPNGRFAGGPTLHPADNTDGIYFYDGLAYLDAYALGRNAEDFRLNRSNPFFLFVSVVQPHWAFRSPCNQDGIDFYAMYNGGPKDDNQAGRIPVDMPTEDEQRFDMTQYHNGYQTVKRARWDEVSDECWRLNRARYYSSITWVDHLLGKFMEKLEHLDDPNNPGMKLSDTTIVCYTTDHGDMMGEKDLWLKNTMFEGSARLPFIMRMPGVLGQGIRSNVLINHVDMFPTLAGLAGIGDGLRPGTEGRNLSEAVRLNDPSRGPERIFSVQGIHPDLTQDPANVMTRTQRYKFIRENNTRPDGKQYLVLFDMENDPFETTNLAYDPAYKDVVDQENKAIDEFLLRQRT